MTGNGPANALVESVFRIGAWHLQAAALQARAAAGGRHAFSTSVRFGTSRLRLTADNGDTHDGIAPYFAHLAEAGDHAAPDLTIHAVTAPASLAAIAPSIAADSFSSPDRVIVFSSRAIMASLHGGSAGEPVLLNVYDASRALGVSVAIDRDAAYGVEGIRPLLEILRWWSATSPLVFAHAAAVGTERAGFLLAGSAGAGKSSTSLAVAGGTLRFLGDDVVTIGLERSHDAPDRPVIGSLYAAARLRPDMVERFGAAPRWFGSGWADWSGKPSQLFTGAALGHMLREAPLSAIVLPRRGAAPGFRAVSTAAALRALAPSTLATMPAGQTRTLDKLMAALAGVPAYEFGVDPDLDGMRAAFERFAARQEFTR